MLFKHRVSSPTVHEVKPGVTSKNMDAELLYNRGPYELWNIADGPQKFLIFVLNFYLDIPKKVRKENNVNGTRETPLDSLSTACLLVMKFRFGVMLCSNLGDENFDGDLSEPAGIICPWAADLHSSLKVSSH